MEVLQIWSQLISTVIWVYFKDILKNLQNVLSGDSCIYFVGIAAELNFTTTVAHPIYRFTWLWLFLDRRVNKNDRVK